MRTIKFRAYKKNWPMADSEDNNVAGADLETIHDMIRSRQREGWNFMQSTGLFDKNGVEIFEGDIVKDDVGNVAVIEWDSASASFEPSDGLDHGLYERMILKPYRTLAVVIGNIYENKELLNI